MLTFALGGLLLGGIIAIPLALLIGIGKFNRKFPAAKWFFLLVLGAFAFLAAMGRSGDPALVLAGVVGLALFIAIPVFAIRWFVRFSRRFPELAGIVLILLVLGGIAWFTIAVQR